MASRCLAGALVAVLVAGCGAHGPRRRAPRAAAHPAKSACERERLASNPGVPGVPLRTALRVPARGAGRFPLIVALHGQSQDGTRFERFTQLTTRAAAAGFAVAYPSTGRPAYAWAVPDEVDAVRRTLVALAHDPCVDPARIFVAGFSAGGRMAAALACRDAELLRGYAAVSGGIPTRRRCRPARGLDLLAIHGTHDGVVPYRGKPHARWRAVPAYVGAWARRDGCRARPAARALAALVTRFSWRGCAHGHRVVLVRIDGSRHGWPPDDAASIDVDATAAVVRFFAG